MAWSGLEIRGLGRMLDSFSLFPWFCNSGRHLPVSLDLRPAFLVVIAWVPFRADSLAAAWSMLMSMAGFHGIALPSMIVGFSPALASIATPVPVLPWLGDARTLSFPAPRYRQ